jgi:hypothetical protein
MRRKLAHVHKASLSVSGSVETGFKYEILPLLWILAAALQRKVAKMVFPTSVFAP